MLDLACKVLSSVSDSDPTTRPSSLTWGKPAPEGLGLQRISVWAKFQRSSHGDYQIRTDPLVALSVTFM